MAHFMQFIAAAPGWVWGVLWVAAGLKIGFKNAVKAAVWIFLIVHYVKF